jgi:hypothetical protein
VPGLFKTGRDQQAGRSSLLLLPVALYVGSNLVVVTYADEKKVPAFRQRQDTEVQTSPKLKVAAKWADPNAGMLVRAADRRLEARNSRIDTGALVRRELLVSALKARALINHERSGFQGLSFPALRSLAMAASSR